MLSEFEVAKPCRNFSQLYLEYYEITFMGIKGNLLIENSKIPGKLHLNSRSLIFEPQDIELPLVRLKYCDALKLKVVPDVSYKNFLGKLSSNGSANSMNKPESAISKLFAKDKVRDKGSKPNLLNSSRPKLDLAQISVKKFISIDRSPPSPYSVEQCDVDILIEIEEKEKTEQFLKYFDEIRSIEDDEDLHHGMVSKLVNKAMKKYVAESRDKVIYYTTCKLVQLFEYFVGFIVVKATKVIEFVPIVNVTKDVNLKIPIREVKFVNDHRYMFKPVGLEVFVYNSNESYLFVFNDNNARDTVKEILTSNAPKILEMHLDVITKMWMNGYLSNYDYLIYLNRFSSRSFNDISQYPVFPWIVNEFSDDEFKLNSKAYYRDLSKPVGALNRNRMILIRKNFEKQQNDKCQKYPAHHFNSFYSTPGYIIFFYTRAVPELILKLQNGPFGPSERIFKSLESLWLNMQTTGCNLTELIPEFFTPNKADFLLNTTRLDLGYTQEGEEIDDVLLPRWAEDMQDFMFYMRAGLESDLASVNLHKWIDLTWGYKQIGTEAEKAENLYYHLCYEKNIDWSVYKNPYHRRAIDIQIGEYGQVPVQLFDHPHPKKRIKIPASMANQGAKKLEEAQAEVDFNNKRLKQLDLDLDMDEKMEQSHIRELSGMAGELSEISDGDLSKFSQSEIKEDSQLDRGEDLAEMIGGLGGMQGVFKKKGPKMS